MLLNAARWLISTLEVTPQLSEQKKPKPKKITLSIDRKILAWPRVAISNEFRICAIT